MLMTSLTNIGVAKYIPPAFDDILQWLDGKQTAHPTDPNLKVLPDQSGNGNDGLLREDEVIHEFIEGYTLNLATDVALWYG